MKMDGALMSKASDEWSTPQDFWDALDAEFHFMVDAAASKTNHKCLTWFGPDNRLFPDALALGLTWGGEGTVWLNPPYSRCREFIAKATSEAKKGCTVVCLVPSRTDTRWWHEHVWDRETHQPRPGVAIRFIKGRLKFGGATAGAPFPSCLVIFTKP